MKIKTILGFFILAIVHLVSSNQLFGSTEGRNFRQDLVAAASGHNGYGRVQIKVYRGPSEAHGHEHFAPHGYWVKQPADDHH